MRRSSFFVATLFFTIVFAGIVWASDGIIVKREAAERFVTLPDGVRFPEGIAANPHNGDIYVATFDTGPNSNKLLRFTKNGKLVAQRDFGGDPLLGLEFNQSDNKVYICNASALVGRTSKIQRIAADFNDKTPIEEVAIITTLGVGAPGPLDVLNPDGSKDTIVFGNNAAAPNALKFNGAGQLFVSDSFQGAIFRIDNLQTCAPSCTVNTVAHDGLLATAGFPAFGANGIDFGSNGHLFIANTGDDRILELDLSTSTVKITVFAESINGADGIAFDDDGHLVVAANQADEIVILNENGRVVAKLGDFLGIRDNGSPRGLLFPASLVIVDDKIFVTNLALPLTEAVGDEPEEDVTRYTISRINIPKNLP
jgi:DNA-binding beta-propeller fold protein YncE